MKASDAVNRGEEDDRAAGVAEEEVVEVDVLRTFVSDRLREGKERRRTFSGRRHSILHSLSVSTSPPSGERSMSSGSGSRKSSLRSKSSARKSPSVASFRAFDDEARTQTRHAVLGLSRLVPPIPLLEVPLQVLTHRRREDESAHVLARGKRVDLGMLGRRRSKVVLVDVLGLDASEKAGSARENTWREGRERTSCDE